MNALELHSGLHVSLDVKHELRHDPQHGLDAREVFSDYYTPICHCFTVLASEPSEDGGWDEATEPAARVLINEYPRHLMPRQEWMWTFDAAEVGTGEPLGVMLDVLEEEGLLGDWSEGAVLHAQNLEVRADMRRLGLGAALLRYALLLTSRTDLDVAIAELAAVSPMFPPLFDETDRGEIEESVAHAFLTSFGFTRWMGSAAGTPIEHLPDTVPVDTPCYYMDVETLRVDVLEG